MEQGEFYPDGEEGMSDRDDEKDEGMPIEIGRPGREKYPPVSRPPLHDRAYFLALGFLSYIELNPNPVNVKMLADLIRSEVLR